MLRAGVCPASPGVVVPAGRAAAAAAARSIILRVAALVTPNSLGVSGVVERLPLARVGESLSVLGVVIPIFISTPEPIDEFITHILPAVIIPVFWPAISKPS